MAKKSSPSQRASYSADADALQKKIEAARSAMPELKKLASPGKGKKQTAGGVVTDKFIEAVAAQAERDPDFRAATKVDPNRLRNGNRFVVAYSPIADALLTFGEETKQLVLETRKRNSEEARAAYAWMQWKAEHLNDAQYARIVKKIRPLMKTQGAGKRAKAAKPGKGSKGARSGSPSTPAADGAGKSGAKDGEGPST